jgi:3-isopropylmalate/(R)-2-methylmalate dehydratase small subunit
MPNIVPFKTFSSIAVPIDIPNCDTDQIIPGRFLRKPNSDPNYHLYLFHDLRFNSDGSEKEFSFNLKQFKNGKIFISDINWGCGSSRENAVIALKANGIKSVIAPSFGDIHYNNCIKNGLLPIQLSESECSLLRRQLHQNSDSEVTIDLGTQSVTGPDSTIYNFKINSFDKLRLIRGLDDISLTMEYEEKIQVFMIDYRKKHGWAM